MFAKNWKRFSWYRSTFILSDCYFIKWLKDYRHVLLSKRKKKGKSVIATVIYHRYARGNQGSRTERGNVLGIWIIQMNLSYAGSKGIKEYEETEGISEYCQIMQPN